MDPLRDLRRIFSAGVERVDPYRMILDRVSLNNNLLRVRSDRNEHLFDLAEFSSVIVLGAGKATAKMALALEEVLGERISEGLISVKRGHTEKLSVVRTMESGHPVPDEMSVRAADDILSLARKADEKTLVILLISGGGSALLCSPYHDGRFGLSFGEKQEVTRLLLSSGADIGEMNCIRKHLSGIKGGRLAEALYPAVSLTLILSDVIGDRLDTIASGLTVPDDTSYGDALSVIEKYGLEDRIPSSALDILHRGAAGELPDTPKQGNKSFERVTNVLIGNNSGALEAARKEAERIGYRTLVLTSRVSGEAREVAKLFAGIGKDMRASGLPLAAPACLIAGGETTVTLKGKGKGGRNQELALSFLAELEREPAVSEGIWFLSGATDGNDGPTDAAGAVSCLGALKAAAALGRKPGAFLARNDAYSFFDGTPFLLRTGPTNTNVCDMLILIVRDDLSPPGGEP